MISDRPHKHADTVPISHRSGQISLLAPLAGRMVGFPAAKQNHTRMDATLTSLVRSTENEIREEGILPRFTKARYIQTNSG